MSVGRPVAVVGGGLVGSLLATMLARRGHDVTVYEQRPDARSGERVAGRSINLVVTRRGLRALERVGLAEQVLRLTVPVTGRMMHPLHGEHTFQPYGRDESECNYSVSRSGLNEFLIAQAEAAGACFRFRARLEDADLDGGRLTFADEAEGGGGKLEVEAPVVFGTDGAGSALRAAMLKRGAVEDSTAWLDHGYKELLIPAAGDGKFRIERNALHIWPRGEFMLMALPNRDGSFTATLYLRHRGEEESFAHVTDEVEVAHLFRTYFLDATTLIPGLPGEFLDNPTGSLGTVRCDPWHLDGRALLLGDAAHAIVPFFGQGMNSGFEDLTALDELLDEHGNDAWETVFSELTRRRKPSADAIADMAIENFTEMREKVGDEQFLLRKAVEHRLEREIPTEYRSRYSMVMYSHIPFETCQAAGRVQQTLLDELCTGLTDANDLDLERARATIHHYLTPFLKEHNIYLDY